MNRQSPRPSPTFPLPRQHNLETATQKALEALRGQGREQLLWLGAAAEGDLWRLAVLNDDLRVDISTGQVFTSAGAEVDPHWRILVLHYLCVASRPPAMPAEVSFADLPTARSYAGVYAKRVTERLCATAGRDAQTLHAAAAALGARGVQAGDVAFDLLAFPHLPVRVIWYAADGEFPPSATLLFPANVESFFCAEDIVVLSELIVSRLAGRPL